MYLSLQGSSLLFHEKFLIEQLFVFCHVQYAEETADMGVIIVSGCLGTYTIMEIQTSLVPCMQGVIAY